ncbi:MAG: TonB family protein [Gammaproteobacteria bacterium]|nr:TonB family protein [Gammaproteobacteria bacterium]MDH4253029.1 TonB family protein [Gammaproteobacteria bacterium]MDH5308549.1 TonB family protein [Gammaproteobacteria bacterium]
MALEQFKTQVLILHSQQSTLDSLVRGFSDRYAVHCATSGAEALSTLGSIQIDVLVSAHNLPGMSGLDALREAKKRSPSTIGILLAGSDAGDGLEALVNDKIVYEVVRGEVTPQRLFKLVEDATRQVRLLALAESANDTTANPDEPAGEHIIMETAENGSVIISDGTGTLPALKPEKIQISPNARGAEVDVLVLTRDEEFLATVKESARGLHNVHHATAPAQAAELARKEGVGVLVTDAAMIGSNIEELTDQLRAHVPRLVAIVAGRRDDGDLLMDLINRGQVYRFLLKPVSPGRARLAIEASVKHHLDAPETAFKGKPRTAASPVQKPAPQPAAPKKPVPAPQARQPRPAPPRAEPPTPAPVSRPAAAPPARPEAPKAPPRKPAEPPAPQTPPVVAKSPPARPAPKPLAASPAQRPGPAPMAAPAKRPGPAPVAAPTKRAGPAPMAAPAKPRPESAAGRKEPRISAPAELSAGGQSPRSPEVAPPVAAGLDQAFDEGGSFTDTIAGLAVSVGKSIGGAVSSVSGGARAVTHVTGAAASGLLRVLRNPKLLAAAGLIAVVAVAGLWVFSGDDSPAPPTAADNGPDSVPTFGESDIPAAEAAAQTERPLTAPLFDDLLDKARAARNDGDIYSPAGRNAMEFYIAARAAAPDNPEVAGELAALTDDVFQLAETALLENHYTEASRALRVIALANPENPRLNFMNAQLAQLELRGRLDEARTAIRESRFEDAGRILSQAESLAGGDARELNLVTEELAAARSAQRLDEVLSLAGRAVDEGRLTTPSNDNARYFYELALTLERGNAAAQQGLTVIASKLVLNARSAIDAGDFDGAERLLTEARALDAGSSELSAANETLAAARAERSRREAEQRAAEQAPAIAGPATAGAAASVPASSPVESEARTAAEPGMPDGGETASPELVGTAALTETPEPMADAQPGNLEPMAETPIVAISTLKRTRYVPPKYPRSAQRRNVEGWVDLVFTVTPEGEVADIEVIDADPATTFNDAAVESVEQWRFDPVLEGNRPVSKRVAVRMSFALQ